MGAYGPEDSPEDSSEGWSEDADIVQTHKISDVSLISFGNCCKDYIRMYIFPNEQIFHADPLFG